MKKKNGFTLVELIVSFALITVISLSFFKTVLTLQEQQLKNIARNNFKSFTITLNNLIQKDFINDKIESIIACGNTCYDITYKSKGIMRLNYDADLNAIVYGDKKEKIPNDYKLIGKIEITNHTSEVVGINSYIVLNINLKGNFDSKIENIKYMFQYDKEETNIELDLVWNGAKYIKSLLDNEVTLKNGLIVDDTDDENIRYAGSDPNNYVYFNCEDTYNGKSYGSEGYDYVKACEIWRIIGVFDIKKEESDTISEKRIKIVRDGLTSKMWDDNGTNQWGESTYSDGSEYAGASLMQYLNIGEESYYNSLSSISKLQTSDALWNIGALANSSIITPLIAYVDERGIKTGLTTNVNNTTLWHGKIGLIYPSDYGYAGNACTNMLDISCGTENWLKPAGSQVFTISVRNQNRLCWYVYNTGTIGARSVTDSRPVQPALYLNTNVQIVGGNGDNEPYILSV